MNSKTDFRRAWERRLELGAPDDVVVDLLENALGGLAGDELDVVGEVIERLKLGRQDYGQWVAVHERRDLVRESLDEELDDVVYRAMRTVMSRRGRVPALRMVGGRDE